MGFVKGYSNLPNKSHVFILAPVLLFSLSQKAKIPFPPAPGQRCSLHVAKRELGISAAESHGGGVCQSKWLAGEGGVCRRGNGAGTTSLLFTASKPSVKQLLPSLLLNDSPGEVKNLGHVYD
jgi:hypothetical protein